MAMLTKCDSAGRRNSTRRYSDSSSGSLQLPEVLENDPRRTNTREEMCADESRLLRLSGTS